MRRISASSAGSLESLDRGAAKELGARSRMQPAGPASRRGRCGIPMAAGVAVLHVEDRVVARRARSPWRGRNRAPRRSCGRACRSARRPRPTSSTTSRKVTNSPARFDIFTGSPARSSRTSWTSFTSSAALPPAHRFHRRLHALDVAAVVGAPDVDQVAEAAVELGFVIGDVGGEISVAAVRFLQRPVDVVAEIGRAEQASARGLPSPRDCRLWAAAGGLHRPRRFCAIPRWCCRPDLAALDQRALGEEHVVAHVERGEIVADHVHHHGDGLGAHERQPFGFRLMAVSLAPYSAASSPPTGLR